MVHSFRPVRAFALLLAFVMFVSASFSSRVAAQNTPRSPSDTVREFYKGMREKRFREAFELSIYKPAIVGLKPEEFEDLRPDFEKLALAIPEKIEVTGEQTSGDIATVFVKVPNGDDAATTEPVTLMRIDGQWIIGDKESQETVKKAGKKFFFNARIDTHQSEAQSMLQRINVVQLVYSQQHAGLFADLPTLIAAGLLPKDIEGTDSTGYRFYITLAKDAKSFTAGAEPAQYGRTGRLSFFMDQSGIRSKDVGGKPLVVPPEKP